MNDIIEIFRHEGRVLGAACRADENSADGPAEGGFLVVDDLRVHQELLSGLLSSLFPGVPVDGAVNGLDAMEKIRERNYRMVLCDWVMPEMDGEALAYWIRKDSGKKNLPFVMVSAKDDHDEMMRAFSEFAVDGYLLKPVTRNGLEQVLAMVEKRGNKP